MKEEKHNAFALPVFLTKLELKLLFHAFYLNQLIFALSYCSLRVHLGRKSSQFGPGHTVIIDCR